MKIRAEEHERRYQLLWVCWRYWQFLQTAFRATFPLVELNPDSIIFVVPIFLIRVKLGYTENVSLLGNLEVVEKFDFVSLG